MYRAVLMLAWFMGTIYATIPLFALVVRPLKKFLDPCHSALRVIIPSWFVMMAVVYSMTWPWRKVVLYHAPAGWLAAVFLFTTAIIIYHRSRLHFSHIQVVRRSELGPGRERRLVTGGIRQHIRHPIYLAHLCMLLAWTVGSREVVLYGLTIFALLTGWPMIPAGGSGTGASFWRRISNLQECCSRRPAAARLPFGQNEATLRITQTWDN